MILGLIVIPVLLIIGYMKFFRNKTVVELCRNIDGRYHVIKSMKIDKTLELFTYKKRDYVVDYKYSVMKNSIINGHYAHFRYDVDDTKPLKTDVNEASKFKMYSPTLLHKIMRTKIFSEILSGATDSQFIFIIMLVTCLSFAVSVYSVYSLMQTQEQVKILISILTKGVVVK